MASFNSAFASARKSGKKVFTWNGKSYNTKLADEAPKKKAFASTPKKGPAPGARAPIPTPKPAQAAKKPGKFDGVDSDMLGKKTSKVKIVPKKEAAFITPANKKMRSDHESFIGTEKKRRNDDLRSMRGK